MKLELSLQEALERARKYMTEGYYWGPSVLQVMWEAYGLDSDEMLWAGTNFYGGVAGHNEGPCGAVSAMAVSLGTRYRVSSDDKEKADQAREEARKKTTEMVKSFKDEFGTIICEDLIGVAGWTREEIFKAVMSGKFQDKCSCYVQFAVNKLFEAEG